MYVLYTQPVIAKIAASNLKFADDLFRRVMANEFRVEDKEDAAIEACLIIWTTGFEEVVLVGVRVKTN